MDYPENKRTGFTYLIFALIVFIIIPTDKLVGMTIMQITHWDISAKFMITVLFATSSVWAISFFAMLTFAKNKHGFDILQNKDKPLTRNIVICVCILVLSVIINYISWDNQIRPIGEYKLLTEYAGNLAWLVFIFQYIYYLFEMALALLIITFSQKAFEILFHNKTIPWGGIVTGILWGFILHVNQGFVPGLQGLINGIAFGVVYLLMNKNPRYVYPLMYLIFLL